MPTATGAPSAPRTMIDPVLRLSPRITLAPIVHGNGDFALEARRLMLEERFDCLAVPLPPSFQRDVEDAIAHLPAITVVTQEATAWSPDREEDASEGTISFVPIDPCQAVIAALRIAREERIPRAFIDLEVDAFEPRGALFPDAYALKRVPLARFAAACLPAVPPLPEGQPRNRVRAMAAALRSLETRFGAILCLCSLLEWPWLRQAYLDPDARPAESDLVEPTRTFRVSGPTLFFVLGELPYITGLYERARAEIEDDANLAVDGVKDLLLETRRRYRTRHAALGADLSPHALGLYLKYVRNLSLMRHRLTPDLYTLAVAAKQMAGDSFALQLVETSRAYPYQRPLPHPDIEFGIDKARLPDGRIVRAVSRLPGPPLVWRTLELTPRPPAGDRRKWRILWDPRSMCSFIPEDKAIERFRSHVVSQAKALAGLDLARSEKFTTSLKDGLDIRETVRRFWSGDIYVKINPPARGSLDCVVMLFDTPADPRKYPWRTTWYPEYAEESTLILYASNYLDDMVGPGIGRAQYGGVLLIYPPRIMPDIWTDPHFDFADTLEERLIAAACAYSRHRRIAFLSPVAPTAVWRRMARMYGRRLVHLPAARFSGQTLRQLRLVHVLNGREVRSYADWFVRRS
ncbi:MAG: hypothetical protein BWX69_01566 [Planctomycetes bacterium ADurb.Bin069]|nr:MAG: hypothetical protein BWX69_01566 [Planctomycetes bacterium ADurb.Bin069]